MAAAETPRRILIVRLGAVGDVIRTLPLLHALRAADAGREIGWVVEEASAPLLSELPALARVHVLPRRALARELRRPWRWAHATSRLLATRDELRDARYALALDAHGTLKAAIVARLAGAGRTVGLGPGGSKEGAWRLYDAAHPFPAAPMSRIRRALWLGAAEGLLGEEGPTGADDDPRTDFGLRFRSARVAAATAFMATVPRPRVVLFPFASASGQGKRWPIERHAALALRLRAEGLGVVVAWGSPRERDEATRSLVAAAGQGHGERAASLLAPPTDLPELCELLRQADLLVTGDTGPMHLAAGVGTRVLALLGPSDPVVNRPWGTGHRVVVARPLSTLEVDAVARDVHELLGQTHERPASG
jgi:lipopolysaccharide heptosyltransferase I